MGKTFVVNASPLILLARIDRLDLLAAAADRIIVPRAVFDELAAGSDRDGAAEAVKLRKDFEFVEDIAVPRKIDLWDLGAGETQVIAQAHRISGSEAVLDDLAARRRAEESGIPVVGTLGLVILCRRRGILERARPVLEELQEAGMRLKRELMDLALKRVDE